MKGAICERGWRRKGTSAEPVRFCRLVSQWGTLHQNSINYQVSLANLVFGAGDGRVAGLRPVLQRARTALIPEQNFLRHRQQNIVRWNLPLEYLPHL